MRMKVGHVKGPCELIFRVVWTVIVHEKYL